MNLPQIIKTLIYIHAALGGVALISGLISMIAQKGGKIHRKSGKLFFYSMTSSALISLVVAILPNHENPFLFTIGIFTIYLTLTGFRALRYKKKMVDLRFDKVISTIMVLTDLGMIFYPILIFGKINIVLTVFGLLGIFLSVLDLKRYQNLTKLKSKYLQLHLTKMIAAYIAAITAFIVVTQIISGLWGWLSPTVIGVFIIVFWLKKLNKKANLD